MNQLEKNSEQSPAIQAYIFSEQYGDVADRLDDYIAECEFYVQINPMKIKWDKLLRLIESIRKESIDIKLVSLTPASEIANDSNQSHYGLMSFQFDDYINDKNGIGIEIRQPTP